MARTQDSFNKYLSSRASFQRKESLRRRSRASSDSRQNIGRNNDDNFPNFQVEAKFEMNISVVPADEETSDSENKIQSKALDVKCVATYRERGKDGVVEIQKSIPPEETTVEEYEYEPRPSRSAPYPDGLHQEPVIVRPSSAFGRGVSVSTQYPSDIREASPVRQDSVRPSSAFARRVSASTQYPSYFGNAPSARQESVRPSSAFGRMVSASTQYPSYFEETSPARQDSLRSSSAFDRRVSTGTQYPSIFEKAPHIRQGSVRSSSAFDQRVSIGTQYPSVLHESPSSVYEQKVPNTTRLLNEASKVLENLRLSQSPSSSKSRGGINKTVSPYTHGSVHSTQKARSTVENPNKLERRHYSKTSTNESMELQDKGPINAVRISLDKDVLLELHPLFPWQEMQVALDDGPGECTCCTSCKS